MGFSMVLLTFPPIRHSPFLTRTDISADDLLNNTYIGIIFFDVLPRKNH